MGAISEAIAKEGAHTWRRITTARSDLVRGESYARRAWPCLDERNPKRNRLQPAQPETPVLKMLEPV